MKLFFTSQIALLLFSLHMNSNAMEVSLQNDAIVMEGSVLSGDFEKLKTLAKANPSVKTVVLKNSLGGHVDTGYETGEWIRDQGMRTVALGYCISSCSRMFLGGVIRQFAQDPNPNEPSFIGFHGHYKSAGQVDSDLVEKKGLHAWIMKFTDGKADPQLVMKWIAFPRNTDVINFFHPEASFPDKLTVRNCERYTRANGAPLRCPGITNTDALTQGVITTLERVSLQP